MKKKSKATTILSTTTTTPKKAKTLSTTTRTTPKNTLNTTTNTPKKATTLSTTISSISRNKKGTFSKKDILTNGVPNKVGIDNYKNTETTTKKKSIKDGTTKSLKRKLKKKSKSKHLNHNDHSKKSQPIVKVKTKKPIQKEGTFFSVKRSNATSNTDNIQGKKTTLDKTKDLFNVTRRNSIKDKFRLSTKPRLMKSTTEKKKASNKKESNPARVNLSYNEKTVDNTKTVGAERTTDAIDRSLTDENVNLNERQENVINPKMLNKLNEIATIPGSVRRQGSYEPNKTISINTFQPLNDLSNVSNVHQIKRNSVRNINIENPTKDPSYSRTPGTTHDDVSLTISSNVSSKPIIMFGNIYDESGDFKSSIINL